jgi:hypothetical protein
VASSTGTVKPLARHSSPLTGVYDPKAFILHAALLRQASAHCAKFPTAASRRSLDRVSVPVWPFALSGRLLIVALVSRYLTNKLISREPLLKRLAPLIPGPCDPGILCGISTAFAVLFPTRGQVVHVLLTRLPLYSWSKPHFLVRLACVRHAASVDSEPGSNSPIINRRVPNFEKSGMLVYYMLWNGCFGHALSSFQRSRLPSIIVFKTRLVNRNRCFT